MALIALPLSAHFKIGVYKGINKQQQECEFEIKSKTFDNNQHHPLNENVMIKINDSEELNFRHLAIVDNTTLKVRPKKEILSAIVPNNTGAVSYELFMNHDGPYKFEKITDTYRDPSKNNLESCTNLVYQD